MLVFPSFFKPFIWRNSLKPKGAHLFQLGLVVQKGTTVTWTACTCACFPFSFPPHGHQSKMESTRLWSSLVGNYSSKSCYVCLNLHPFFFHFPAPALLPGPNCSSVFFSASFLLAGAPAVLCGTNRRNAAMEMSRVLPWRCCPRAGAALWVPKQPPDEALEHSRCEQGRG